MRATLIAAGKDGLIVDPDGAVVPDTSAEDLRDDVFRTVDEALEAAIATKSAHAPRRRMG
jgi:hypothetical protein